MIGQAVGTLLLALPILFLAASAAAQAAWQPSHSVRLLIGFGPGTSNDVMARLIAPRFGEHLGQPVVVENRGGAGGVIAADVLAKSAPDGHAIGVLVAAQLSVNQHLMPRLPYDPDRDFTPIAELMDFPSAVVVPSASPARDLDGLRDWLRSQQGRATCSGATVGSIPHLGMVLLLRGWGVDCPLLFSGASGPVQEIVAGRVAFGLPNVAAVAALIDGGPLRVLAVTSTARLAALPDIPAAAETIPGFEVVSWAALYGPAGLPPAVAEAIAAALHRTLREPEIAARLSQLSAVPRWGDGAAAAARAKAESERWGRVIREAGIRLE